MNEHLTRPSTAESHGDAGDSSAIGSAFRRLDEDDLAGGVGNAFRVSVTAPTVSNPPDRVPFTPAFFTALESWLFDLAGGWTLRPGLYVGEWSSSTLGRVRDESRVYDVIVPSFTRARVVTARLSSFVSELFDQEHVLITITPEYSTLSAIETTWQDALGGTDDFTSLG